MDFLKNAAKIAEQVQGGKSHGEGGGSGGGYGDMLGGFMGGDKPKPRRDEEDQDYEQERPHGSQSHKPRRDEEDQDYEQQQERPHGSQSQSSAEQKKKPSTGELFGDARLLYQAAAGGKVDQGKLAGAASDLLEGLSMYGGEKNPYGKYAQQASTYLDSYGKKHEVPAGAPGAVKPPSGHGRPSEDDEDSYPSKPRPSQYDSEEPESRPSKPRPSKYESEESEYGEQLHKPPPPSEEFAYGDRPQKPRPSRHESEESEYGDRPQKPRPSQYGNEEEYDGPRRPQKSQYENQEEYDGPRRPQKNQYENEEEYGAPRRPQKTQTEDEEYGGGYSRKPQKSQYDEEDAPGPYGSRPQRAEEGPYGSEGHGRASKPSYNDEEESEKPKKSWYD